MKLKKLIIRIREEILRHVRNEYIRKLIYGLISYEMLAYMFFGFFTALIDYTVYAFFSSLGVNALLSNVISWIFSVLFAYVTNRRWVFKIKVKHLMAILDEFIKFVSVRMFTLIMSEVIIFVAQIINANTYSAKLIAMVLTVILNYVFSKLFIFNKEGKKG